MHILILCACKQQSKALQAQALCAKRNVRMLRGCRHLAAAGVAALGLQSSNCRGERARRVRLYRGVPAPARARTQNTSRHGPAQVGCTSLELARVQ
jgi:hypothetical protein